MDRALRLASGRTGAKLSLPQPVHYRFGDDRARRIAGAEEQHVERFLSGSRMATSSRGLRLRGRRAARGLGKASCRSQSSGCPSQQSVTRKPTSARMPSTSARYTIERPSRVPRTSPARARMARCVDSVLCGHPIVSAIAPAARPSGSCRISRRKIASRVGWPSAASAESACGLVMRWPPRQAQSDRQRPARVSPCVAPAAIFLEFSTYGIMP